MLISPALLYFNMEVQRANETAEIKAAYINNHQPNGVNVIILSLYCGSPSKSNNREQIVNCRPVSPNGWISMASCFAKIIAKAPTSPDIIMYPSPVHWKAN